MNELKQEQNENTIITKTHEEILKMIKEIKEFEKRFQDNTFEEIEPNLEFVEIDQNAIEFIEVENVEPEHISEIENDIPEQNEPIVEKIETTPFEPLDQEITKPKLKDKFSKIRRAKIRYRSRPEVKKIKLEAKETIPATFKIRFNEDEKLENIDLNKPKPKLESKKHFKFRKIRVRRKEETEETEKESKFSKIKGGLEKISMLKKAIPRRSKNEEESEKSEAEE